VNSAVQQSLRSVQAHFTSTPSSSAITADAFLEHFVRPTATSHNASSTKRRRSDSFPELVRHDIHVDTSREKNVKSFPRSGNVENPERPASPLGSEYEVVLLTFSKAFLSNEDIFHYHSAGNVSLIPGLGDFVVLRLQPERRKSSAVFYVGLVNARYENGWTIK
jgi:hypothetical protein